MTEKKFEKILSKRKLVLAGLIVIIFILIGGTFAFQQLSQGALNPDRVDIFPGGRIHDISQERGHSNVDGERIYQDFHGERNKNVFAENFGDIPIGVRVQFREFVELNGDAIVNLELPVSAHHGTGGGEPNEPNNAMDLNNLGTWSIAQFEAGPNGELVRRAGTTAAYISDLGIDWQMGDEEGKVFMPTFNQVNRPLSQTQFLPAVDIHVDIQNDEDTIFNHTFVYQFSDASGRSVDGVAEDFDLTNGINEISDIELYGVQTGYTGHDGSRDFWAMGDYRVANRYFIEENVLVRRQETHYAKRTLTPDEGGVMLMSVWIEADKPDGNFWLFDDFNYADGWFYWNGNYHGMIMPGEGTSLLINASHMPIHTNLGYVIHINADFFTADNLPENMSDEAQMIYSGANDGEEMTFIADSVITVNNTDIARGSVNQIIGDFVSELEIRRGNLVVETLEDADFFATFAHDVATGTTIEVVNLDGVQSLQISIDTNETLSVLTIQISEERAENYLEIILNVIN